MGEGSGYDTVTSTYEALYRRGYLTTDSQEGKGNRGDHGVLKKFWIPWLKQRFWKTAIEDAGETAKLSLFYTEPTYVEFWCTSAQADVVYTIVRKAQASHESDFVFNLCVLYDARLGSNIYLDGDLSKNDEKGGWVPGLATRGLAGPDQAWLVNDATGKEVMRAPRHDLAIKPRRSLLNVDLTRSSQSEFVARFCNYKSILGDHYHSKLVPNLLNTPLVHIMLSSKVGCVKESAGAWLLRALQTHAQKK